MNEQKEKIIDYTPAAKSGCRKCFILSGVAFLITWTAMLFLWGSTPVSVIGGTEDSRDLSEKISMLEGNLKQLNEEVKNQQQLHIANLPAELPDGLAASSNEEVKAISQQVKTIEAQMAKINEMEKEIAQTKEVAAQIQKGNHGALILALTQVQQQIQRGQPFDAELRLVEAQAGEDLVIKQSLDVLKEHGGRGVVSAEKLRDEFTKIANKIVSESKKSQEKTVWDRTKNELMDIVKIRRVDNVDGDSTEAVVARAEKALEGYNISSAVVELENLGAAPKKVIEGWLEQAGARITVEDAVNNIIVRITQESSLKVEGNL